MIKNKFPHPQPFPSCLGKGEKQIDLPSPRRRGRWRKAPDGGIILLFLLLFSFVFAESNFYFEHKFSNKNFTFNSRSITDRKNLTYNYDRFRTDLDLGWEKIATFKIIFDLENYLGKSYLKNDQFRALRSIKLNMPLDPYHYIVSENAQVLRTYLYRAYGTFYLPQSTLTLGYQRIPLGVGRIWNPTDIINPYNPLSIESAERLGIYGGLYTYNIDDLSQFKTFFTKNSYSELKDYGYIVKRNIDKYDIGISYVGNKDLTLTGVEIEREILATGIEARTEFAHIDSKVLEKKYQKYIIGLDHGFPNSTYIVVEYFFNEIGATDKNDYDLARIDLLDWQQLAKSYLGATLSYEFTPLLSGSLAAISNLNDGSFFLSPSVHWSIQENLDLDLGSSFYQGQKYTEFWYYQTVNYFSFSNYF